MPLTQAELIQRLHEIEARIADLRAEGRDETFIVEEVASLGDKLASDAGGRAGWIEDQVTMILAKHGLLDEAASLGDDWET